MEDENVSEEHQRTFQLPLRQLDTPCAEPRKKVLRRFYEPLLLLEALGRVRPAPVHEFTEVASVTTAGLRRSFVDGIAYLCAPERFSAAVTSVALQKTPQGPVIWLASNSGIEAETVSFLEGILRSLHQITVQVRSGDRMRVASEITPDLLHQVVIFNAPRLQKYVRNVCNVDLQACIRLLRDESDQDARNRSRIRSLCHWLEQTFLADIDVSQIDSLPHLVIDCYLRRIRRSFEPLRLRACQGEQRSSDFGRLFLVLSKLGKHVTFTRRVVEATVHLNDDLSEPMRVSVIPASIQKPFPLIKKEGTIESILGRAFSNATERDAFRTRMRLLWNEEEVMTILTRERPSKTKVHAELLLADYFYRHNFHFLDGNDKYIGCSKRTCYLCDIYLRSHPASFAGPPSHQKIYTSWRCPDVSQSDPVFLRDLQDQLWQAMIDQVRKDLKKEVNSRANRIAIPPDSTIGATSEDHPVFPPFAVDKLNLMLNYERHRLQAEEHVESDSEGGVRIDETLAE